MIREGFRANSNLASDLHECGADRETELVHALDLLSEKLKLLENKDLRLNENANSVDKPADETPCNFKDTCYTARFNMGSCPCELRR